MKKLTISILLLLCFFSVFERTAFSTHENKDEAKKVVGNVDSVAVEGNTLLLQGWAGPVIPESRIVALRVRLGDTVLYQGGFESFDRRDVVKAKGRNDWLKSGWRLKIPLPGDMKAGKFPLNAAAELDNGAIETLAVDPSISAIVVEGDNRIIIEKKGTGKLLLLQVLSDKVAKIRLILILLAVTVCATFFQADTLAAWLGARTGFCPPPSALFSLSLLLAFAVIVGLGLTGSSFRLGVQSSAFVRSDGMNIWGQDKPIRSDEWIVSTPLAIAQFNHRPQFPIVNTNLGEDGQNMLVVNGVPVKHISMIAKPATWGFFLFDLRRALSWYWYFPLFACLFALWGVASLISPGDWKSSFLVSFWFVLSPFVAAWSDTPANTLFFPSVALCAAVAIFRAENRYLLLGLGVLLGIALAGFVLILYPPWQIPLAYVFLALAAGIFLRDRLSQKINIFRLSAFGLAIFIAGLILWQWWSDARSAIEVLSATEYPGKRIMMNGGDYSLLDLLRGFTNIVTLYKLGGTYSNQSEIASFPYLFLPLLVLFLIRWLKKSVGTIEIALTSIVCLILCFMFIGLPAGIAKYSLWGRVPPQRADIALGLSYMLLCGRLMATDFPPISQRMPVKILAFFGSVCWAAVVGRTFSHFDSATLSGFSQGITVGLLIIITIAGYWLILGRLRDFLYLNILLSLASTIAFNPINMAPNELTSFPAINQVIKKEHNNSDAYRVLVLESIIPSMYLLAQGFPVANGVLYYPQHSLWQRLDQGGNTLKTYNRYQHLLFLAGKIDGPEFFKIESSVADQVKVTIDLEKFDFRKTGAKVIAAPKNEEAMLQKNTTLTHVVNEGGWSWFQVMGL